MCTVGVVSPFLNLRSNSDPDTTLARQAEAAQIYFNVKAEGKQGGGGTQNDINTREELRTYDPTLYNLVRQMFPCNNTYLKRCESTRGKSPSDACTPRPLPPSHPLLIIRQPTCLPVFQSVCVDVCWCIRHTHTTVLTMQTCISGVKTWTAQTEDMHLKREDLDSANRGHVSHA